MKIWVDDLRQPTNDWFWLKTSAETIAYLEYVKATGGVDTITHMSLDHDLGGDDTTRPIVLWMCENDIWPVEITVHSANPVGIEWLEGMIERYKNW